jgi:uridine kinase
MGASRIHITGASGSGTTTLGRALAEHLGIRPLDGDDYYWLPTSPPYRTKRDADERNELLLADINAPFVLSGSVVGWGRPIEDAFDLIVLLEAPTDIRLERLRLREMAEAGQVDDDFIAYAAAYDDGGLDIRSRTRQELWIAAHSCPVLRLDGTEPVADNVALVSALAT